MKGIRIAVANHKGGVAKTTTTALLGLALSKLNRKVLLIDLDAQCNLTNFFPFEEEEKANIYDVLVNGKKAEPIRLRENLYLIPSSLLLARAEVDIVSRANKERLLLDAIENIKKDFDYMLFDCPPALNIITTNALTAATEVYIPTTAEVMPLRGLATLENIINEVKDSINKELRIGGIIITRCNNRKLNKMVIDAIQGKFKDILFNTRVRENIAVAESPLLGGDIFEKNPKSNGAQDYSQLAEEVVAREGK